MSSFTIQGNLVDIQSKKIFPASVVIEDKRIKSITSTDLPQEYENQYILPGFIDSHVHIESSMLVPSEFAKLAVVHGTVATVSDPHEIANVCGMEGVNFMIENGKQVNFKFNFGAPSCVPATNFETAGAVLNSDDVKALLQREEIKYLSEMMNFPGVWYKDEEVMKKIQYAIELGKPIDGHAPGLRGSKAKQYIQASNNFDIEENQSTNKDELGVIISTDHECFTAAEALEKLQLGMKILIREGSAAKNFDALIDLLNDYEDEIMFCSDDKHPDSLVVGHINQLCARAVAKKIDVFKVLKAACVNPVKHYNLKVGLLQVGDEADFIVVEDLIDFSVKATYINGDKVAENKESFISSVATQAINKFNCTAIATKDIEIKSSEYTTDEIPVIEALDGQLITNKWYSSKQQLATLNDKNESCLCSNTAIDVLKIVVINRYNAAPISKAFIKNFGFKKGAIASTVAHDSHNIIAVGADDESLVLAINKVIACSGGISIAYNNTFSVLPLPVAGLMTNENGYKVAQDYTHIDALTKDILGSTLQSPFMTLSFMALLVIPSLKLSDKGLFDGEKFTFVNV
jgi:adenine deaminase